MLSVVAVATVRLDAVVLNRDMDAHGPLTSVFLHDLRRESGNASDDKHEFSE